MDDVTKKTIAYEIGQIGACLSDIVVCVYGLATENETGKLLEQRALEINASAASLLRRVNVIVALRR